MLTSVACLTLHLTDGMNIIKAKLAPLVQRDQNSRGEKSYCAVNEEVPHKTN